MTMIDLVKIQEAVAAMDKVTVKGGKQYTQVAQRVEAFRRHIGDQLGMESELIIDDSERVVMKAIIKSRDGFVVATGWAEELRGQGVNKMACIENTETSAYGRALANLGIHGGEFASADEIGKAERNNTVIDEKAQWQQWAAACEAHVQTLTSQAALMAWSHENDQNCKTLAGVDQAAHDSLEQAWTAHMEKLKNG